MSWCRFSEDSDLYIYDSAGYDGIVCCACLLKGMYTTKSKERMMAHIRLHIKRGHKVPEYLKREAMKQ